MSSGKDNYNNDDISLKDLILRIIEFKNEILNSKITLLAFILPLILFFSYNSIVEKPSYVAKLTFMLNKSDGGLGGLGSLLGQIGIGDKGKYSKEKMMTLGKSRRIIGKAIFQDATINETTDLLANHLINHLDTLGQWAHTKWYMKPFAKPNPLVGFRFKSAEIDSFDLLSKAAYKTVYETIAGNPKSGTGGIMSNSFDDDSGVMEITVKTKDPELSVVLSNYFFDELSEFYIDKTVEKQKATYDILKSKADSLQNLLSAKQSALAVFEDRAHGLWTKTAKLRKSKLQQDLKKLTIIYGEVLKNLEIADFTLKNKTPFVQTIDRPILPITGTKTSLLKAIVLGFILGLILGIIFVIFRKIIRDTMSE